MASKFLSFAACRPVVAAEGNGTLPRMWLGSSVQAAVGVYVPYLPEPRSTESGRGARSEVFTRHVSNFSRVFQRVIQLLAEPYVRRETWAIERDNPFWTFDLRICGGGTPGCTPASSRDPKVNDPPRIALVIKGVVETSVGGEAASLKMLHERLEEVASRFRSLAPNDLTTLPVLWDSEGPLVVVEDSQARVRPEGLGFGFGYNHSVEIRRALVGSLGRRYSNILDYKKEVQCEASATVPLRWPMSSTDGLATCTAILSHQSPTVLSIRVHPTRLTYIEAQSISEKISKIRRTHHPGQLVARTTLKAMLRQRDFFQCLIQISSVSENVATMVGQAFISEHVLSGSRKDVSSDARRLSSVRAVIPEEQVVAEYNLRNIEMLPWGFAWPEALAASQPASNAPLVFEQSRLSLSDGSVSQVAIKPSGHVPSNDIQKLLNLPDYFLERDSEGVAPLARMRSLFSVGELLSVFRLPAVPPGGHPGLQSRYPNPFEQLPEPTPANGDAVSLGYVQSRGLDTATEFRVPFAPIRPEQSVRGVAGVGDRSIVVVGSPGSGKTNFCLWFLRQLWRSQGNGFKSGALRERKTPFLVIDPTRGNEFRALIDRPAVEGSEDVVLFTVGDPRCSPFCFNPFHVPRKVSIQSHISRLMSCFRAAYEMWDPLPAIFEMALRRAYEGTRRIWWEKREFDNASASGRSARNWSASIDFSEDGAEPFPRLADLVSAMGKGEPGETFRGLRTVMSEQKEMWGGTTENAHTIVASTYLRLRNLFDNYDSIIGGFQAGRECIDLRKLMERPAILEFGMIGDSQALALIMSFLVCALAGTIEGRAVPETEGRQIHMLVLEEAHRLLAGDHSGGKHGSNSKAQAAEDINTMLAEVRKYGQGVMVIDQRPGSLVGGVIDNAYLVAMHRLNEEKGFKQFVQQLNLNADQQRFVRSELRPGQMVTLDRRSGSPVLVRPGNERTDAAKMTDKELRDLMAPRVDRLRTRHMEVGQDAEELGQDISSGRLSGIPCSTKQLGFESTPRVKRAYEEYFANTLIAYETDSDCENRKRLADCFLQDCRQYAVLFDKSLVGSPAESLWIKVAEWYVANRGLSSDLVDRIKGDLE